MHRHPWSPRKNRHSHMPNFEWRNPPFQEPDHENESRNYNHGPCNWQNSPFQESGDENKGPYHKHRYNRYDEWQPQRKKLFRRFMGGFGFLVLIGVIILIAAIFMLIKNAEIIFPNHPVARVTGILLACGLPFLLPLVLGLAGRQFSHNIASPLADVMAGADAVAEGNLDVEVSEHNPGGFGRLARSFNHMIVELRRAEQQRRNLTADVAHELRTPLHIIQGNLEGILDGVYEATPEHIQNTLFETRRLARLVEDLQTLALAEAGKLNLVREEVDVRELLEDVSTSFSGQAEDAGVSLITDSPDLDTLQIHADAGRIYQVLGNLVSNALRYTPRGGQITLKASKLPDAAQITISDTGEGISGEDLPYIFDRFWRADRARTHVADSGSGLGLAISRQLIQSHGGTIRADSTVGKGTTFTIVLPL